MPPSLNSGDNFHPNGCVYGVQSAAIPLQAIPGQSPLSFSSNRNERDEATGHKFPT